MTLDQKSELMQRIHAVVSERRDWLRSKHFRVDGVASHGGINGNGDINVVLWAVKDEEEVIDALAIVSLDGRTLNFEYGLWSWSHNLVYEVEGQVDMDLVEQWADHIVDEVRRFFGECEPQMLKILGSL